MAFYTNNRLFVVKSDNTEYRLIYFGHKIALADNWNKIYSLAQNAGHKSIEALNEPDNFPFDVDANILESIKILAISSMGIMVTFYTRDGKLYYYVLSSLIEIKHDIVIVQLYVNHDKISVLDDLGAIHIYNTYTNNWIFPTISNDHNVGFTKFRYVPLSSRHYLLNDNGNIVCFSTDTNQQYGSNIVDFQISDEYLLAIDTNGILYGKIEFRDTPLQKIHLSYKNAELAVSDFIFGKFKCKYNLIIVDTQFDIYLAKSDTVSDTVTDIELVEKPWNNQRLHHISIIGYLPSFELDNGIIYTLDVNSRKFTLVDYFVQHPIVRKKQSSLKSARKN